PGKLDDHAQRLLQPIAAPALTKVKPLLHELKSQILKHTCQDPFNVVVGVPGSFQWKHRSEIRKFLTHLLGPAATILATAGQPALATVTFDLHRFREETTVLVVDYNYASLDLTVAETFNFMTDPFAHISLPLLGEDYLSLKLASLSSGDISAANYDILRSQARNISLHRMMEVDPHTTSGDYTSEMHAVESKHFDTAISSMLQFLHQNTHRTLITGSNYKPVLSELTHILISGDASSRGFQGLRRAIASEKTILVGLLDPGLEANASSPGWISADGAAKNVQQRRFDDYGKWNWHVHGEL
ncbi:MAG: hypothetical protein Q9204_005516, partial [Flavoplaca sp. TL-2023a]